MELYQYDLSEYDQADVNPAGQFAYPYLDLYWIESDRQPFIVRVQDKLAGFVLVNRHVGPIFQELRWSVAEFFIRFFDNSLPDDSLPDDSIPEEA